MDSYDFNPARRRFLTGMLAVGAASALGPNPLIKKSGRQVKTRSSGSSPVRILARLKRG